MSLVRPLGDPLIELVATRLRVLGQPVRWRLIDRLEYRGETHVQALADELATTQQNTSKHLVALRRAGILTGRQEGRVTFYALADRETFLLIERVAIAVAFELREFTDRDCLARRAQLTIASRTASA